MRAIIKEDEAYDYAIEIALDWWIKNATEASWKELISSVDECGENDTAHAMRKKMSEEGNYKLKTKYYYLCDEPHYQLYTVTTHQIHHDMFFPLSCFCPHFALKN